MEEIGAVNTPVEETTPTESATVETETDDTQSPPADAIVEPEKRVSDMVPRDRFNEVLEERNQLREYAFQQRPQAPAPSESWYDESGINPQALEQTMDMRARTGARQTFMEYEAEKFANKNREALTNDPILRATVLELERQQLTKGAVD